MKKYICIIFSVIFVLSSCFIFYSCGNSKPEAKVDLSAVMSDIKKNVPLSGDMMDLNVDDLLDYYGIDSSSVASFAASQDNCGYLDEIVMIEAVDENSVDTIKSLLDDYIEYKKDEMRNYLPKQFEVLSKCSVGTNGRYVTLFISASADEMNKIFEGYIK